MDLQAVAEGFAVALKTIVPMRADHEIPSVINPPHAIIELGKGDWESELDAVRAEWTVLVCLSVAPNRTSQQQIRAYCNATGDQSVKLAIESDGGTLSGTCSAVVCDDWDKPAVYTIAGTDYWGVQFNCWTID